MPILAPKPGYTEPLQYPDSRSSRYRPPARALDIGMPQATILTATDLARSFGPDEIFRDVSFQLSEREHVALVGVNGAGKSTLLRIIGGLDTSSRGEVAIASGARVAILAQEP